MPSDDQRASRRASRLAVAVSDEHGRPVRAAGLGAWLSQVAPARARGTVSVALADDQTVRRLNRRYRRKDRATDVLAFPSLQVLAPRLHLGDIVIARGVARRQARTHGHSIETEIRVLALHGLLHLLGYDHERDHGEMARLEASLHARHGLSPARVLPQRRPVLNTRERHRASASGVGVAASAKAPASVAEAKRRPGPHASKK